MRNRWRVVQNGADLAGVDRVLAEAPTRHDATQFTVVSVGRFETVRDNNALVDDFAPMSESDDGLAMIGIKARKDPVYRDPSGIEVLEAASS